LPHTESDTDATLDGSWPARVRKGFRAHPFAIIATVVALALGIALTTAGWTATSSSETSPGQLPPLPPRQHNTLLSPGLVSLEAADAAGHFISVTRDTAALAAVSPADSASARRAATLTAVPGLATASSSTSPYGSPSSATRPGSPSSATRPGSPSSPTPSGSPSNSMAPGSPGDSTAAGSPSSPTPSGSPSNSTAPGSPAGATPGIFPGRNCFSFQAADGRFLHDSAGRLRLAAADHSPAFAREATFCLRDGYAPGSALLEEAGHRGRFVRHLGAELRVSEGDPRGCSFLIREPLART
jgi:hypothetical protein